MSTIFNIPIINPTASFNIVTTLENVNYTLRFDWNERDTTWYIDILDATGANILGRAPLNINTDITSRFQIEGLFPGILMLIDTSGQDLEAGFADLGSRCLLYYQAYPN